MKLFNLNTLKIYLMMFIFLQSQSVLAGGSTQVGTMIYSIPGGATAVPSLSGTMLIVLSLLLFLVAFRVSKQKGARNNKLFVTLLGAFALSSSIGGVKTISEANAGIEAQAITLDTTGSVDIFGPQTNYFDNSFEVPVTILSININEGFSCNNSNAAEFKPIDTIAPICSDIAPGNIIPAGDQCQLSCSSNTMFSDERLKNSIKPLLKLDNDIQIYSFNYNNNNKETFVGAMAQDLLKDSRYKHSVKKMPNDYYAVNYQALGLKMVTLKQWQDNPKAIFRDQ